MSIKRQLTEARDIESGDSYALSDINSPSYPSYPHQHPPHQRSSSSTSSHLRHSSLSKLSLGAILGYTIQTHPPFLLSLAFSLISSLFLAWILGYYSTFFGYFVFFALCVPGMLLWDLLHLFGWRNRSPGGGWRPVPSEEGDRESMRSSRLNRGWRGDTVEEGKGKGRMTRMRVQWNGWNRGRRWRVRLCALWTAFMIVAPRYPSSSPLSWKESSSKKSSIARDDGDDSPFSLTDINLSVVPPIRASYSKKSKNQKSKIFIASNLYNAAHVIPSWTSNLRQLVAHLDDPSDVYISIFESNSEDGTPERLYELEKEMKALGVGTKFVTSLGKHADDEHHDEDHKDDEDHHNVKREMGRKERRASLPAARPKFSPNSHDRIAYMAELRNEAMHPLYDLVHEDDEHHFDDDEHHEDDHHDDGEGAGGGKMRKRDEWAKVVWINDVFWDWRSLIHLINTRQGDYDLVCGLDFDGVGMYDTWVMRDACGRPTKEIWPYVASTSDNAGTISKIRHNEPFEVASCWNGLAVFDAGWFLGDIPPNKATSKTGKKARGDAPFPLTFRDNAQGCVESECYLSSLDMHTHSKPDRPSIWVNPSVLTAYTPLQYLFHTKLEQLTLSVPWKILWQDLMGNVLFGGMVVDRFWGEEDRCGRETRFVLGEGCPKSDEL